MHRSSRHDSTARRYRFLVLRPVGPCDNNVWRVGTRAAGLRTFSRAVTTALTSRRRRRHDDVDVTTTSTAAATNVNYHIERGRLAADRRKRIFLYVYVHTLCLRRVCPAHVRVCYDHVFHCFASGAPAHDVVRRGTCIRYTISISLIIISGPTKGAPAARLRAARS